MSENSGIPVEQVSNGRAHPTRNNTGRNNRGNTANNRKNRQINLSHNVDMKKYDRMIAAAHNNFSDIPCGKSTKDCVICCKPNDVFGLGSCRHPVCAECAIRIRILENSKTCPACRGEIDILYFCDTSYNLENVSLSFPKSGHLDEDRYDIRFSNELSGKKYEKYLAHVCKICKQEGDDRLEFSTFSALRQHMANSHEMSYCHICTENLILFSRERKAYTRELLQRHIRIGDFDDKSFKGHPQCLFCPQKFLDQENQYKHLRKEHFFCQFCESDGTTTNVFFGKHEQLKKHYREQHYTCEMTECKEMGIAFASKVELELHKATEHSEKRIDLGFEHARPSSSGRGRGQTANGSSMLVNRDRISLVKRQEPVIQRSDSNNFTVVRSAQSQNVNLVSGGRGAFRPDTQDFPSLCPTPPQLRSSDFPRLNKVNKPQQQPQNTVSQVEEYPELGGSSSSSAPRITVAPIMKKKNQVVMSQKKVSVEQKPKKPSNRLYDEEENEFFSKRDVPQTVIKVNNTKLRYDLVDNRVAPTAKSNIQLISRPEQSKATSTMSALPPAKNDFPSLPIPSAPIAPGNSVWLNAKNKKNVGIINSVAVPPNYSSKQQSKNKKTVPKAPKNEVWSSLGRAPSPPPVKKDAEEWQTVPLSKEAQMEKEKRERKEEWARKKAEFKAEMAAKNGKESWDQKKAEFQAKMADATKNKNEEEKVQNEQGEEWKEVSAQKEKLNQSVTREKKKKSKSEDNMKNQTNTEEKSNQYRKENVDMVTSTSTDPFTSILNMPSVTSLFSNFSLSNLWGVANSNTIPESSPISPPPGLETVAVNPPPGLETVSFASAPIISHDDVKKKREEREKKEQIVADDGWSMPKGTIRGKKNNKKK